MFSIFYSNDAESATILENDTPDIKGTTYNLNVNQQGKPLI